MIGGYDIVVDIKTGANDISFCMGYLKHLWPACVIVVCTPHEEWLIFQSQEISDATEARGVTGSLGKHMLHIIRQPSALTIVCDGPKTVLAKRVREMLHGLTQHRANFGPWT